MTISGQGWCARTKMLLLLPVLALVGLALPGCSDQTSTESGSKSPPPTAAKDLPSTPAVKDRTVVVDGKTYTCGELIGAPSSRCDESYQKAFNRWGDRLLIYANGDRLGAFAREIRFEDVAAAGLAACIMAERGESVQKFVDFMRESYPDEDSTGFLPLRFEAGQSVCPGVGINPNPGSDRIP